jgi:hypothetical protein
MFHFRVHYGSQDLNALVGWIRSNAVVTIIVREEGDRSHIHSIINPIKTVSTFRQQFLKKYINLKGNGSYSLEEVKEYDKLIRYVCKGNSKDELPDVLYQKDINVEELHVEYWKTNQEIKEKIKEKKRVLTWSQQVKKDFSEQFPEEVNAIQTFCSLYKLTELEVAAYQQSKMKLFDFMMGCLGQHVKVLDDMIIIRLFRGIFNSYVQSSINRLSYNRALYARLDINV